MHGNIAKGILATACLIAAFLAMIHVDGQTITNYCNSTELNYTMPDDCYSTGPGLHKSRSICFQSNSTKRVIYRYDFYQCIQFGLGYIMVTKNCSQPTAPANVNYTMVFNRFNEGTKKCDLTPPDLSAILMMTG